MKTILIQIIKIMILIKKFIFFCLILLLFINFTAKGSANPWNFKAYEKDSQEKGYTKFSDFISKLKADKRYNYVEDYLELYRFPLLYGEKDMLKNIANLRFALTRRFRSPYKALCKITSKKEYLKYRLLLFMRLNILIARNFLRIGAHYDKRHIHFHDIAYAKELEMSFKIAKLMYKEAIPYWLKAREYAKRASAIRRDLDLDYVETERFDIIKGEINFGRMAKIYLARLAKKKKKVDEFLKALAENND